MRLSWLDTDVSIADAVAGHAGDVPVPSAMPHEILGGLALLSAIGVILIIIGSIGIWLLAKIERHLRRPR